MNKTSLNMWCGAFLMNHLKLRYTFAKLYHCKFPPMFVYDMIAPFLIFELSDGQVSWHIIIPRVHVENHLEAKAFADEEVKNLDARFC